VVGGTAVRFARALGRCGGAIYELTRCSYRPVTNSRSCGAETDPWRTGSVRRTRGPSRADRPCRAEVHYRRHIERAEREWLIVSVSERWNNEWQDWRTRVRHRYEMTLSCRCEWLNEPHHQKNDCSDWQRLNIRSHSLSELHHHRNSLNAHASACDMMRCAVLFKCT